MVTWRRSIGVAVAGACPTPETGAVPEATSPAWASRAPHSPQNRADGAMVLARWALGASLVSLVAVGLQVVAVLARAMNPSLP